MSKRKFLEALAMARAGRIDEAVKLVRELEIGFVRKRLAHYRNQPDQREAALQLSAALDARGPAARSAPAPEPRPFDAPLSFDPAPAGGERVRLFEARENTVAAAEIGRSRIQPALLQRRAVELDFSGLDLCTQSWLHALLFEPVRLAWALRVPIHIAHADPAVREGLRFLEAYALGG